MLVKGQRDSSLVALVSVLSCSDSSLVALVSVLSCRDSSLVALISVLSSLFFGGFSFSPAVTLLWWF